MIKKILEKLNDDEKKLLRTLLLNNFLVLAYVLIFIIRGNFYHLGWLLIIFIVFAIFLIINLVTKFILFVVISMSYKFIDEKMENKKLALFCKNFLRYVGFIADFLILLKFYPFISIIFMLGF